jgi:hypothetical protein
VPPPRSTDQFELKPAQQRVLGVLKSEGTSRLTRARYEQLSGVSRSQAAYDLAELVEHGILERVGEGRATRYRLVQTTAAGGGRRRWTQERIRATLEDFCAGRDSWPSPAEFRQAGRFDLYVAASRYGGIGFWISELGLSNEPRTEPPATPRRWSLRPPARVVAAVGVAVLALAAAGAGRLQLTPGPSFFAAGAPKLAPEPAFRPTKARSAAPRAKRRTPTARRAKPAAQSRPTVSTSNATVEASSARSVSETGSAPAQKPVSRTPPPASSGSSSSGPAPLRAPVSTETRRPLPPPTG